ncbi:MAG: hypothetical protein ACTSVY_01810 [Candidatus Helarchaeota archaeon]
MSPVDCSNCVKSEKFNLKRKNEECPVNDKYRQNHDTCDFKKTPEELEKELANAKKYYCPKHGMVAGWIFSRPQGGSSAPLFRFCPIEGCMVRRRGG